jgi:hypothetical protein
MLKQLLKLGYENLPIVGRVLELGTEAIKCPRDRAQIGVGSLFGILGDPLGDALEIGCRVSPLLLGEFAAPNASGGTIWKNTAAATSTGAAQTARGSLTAMKPRGSTAPAFLSACASKAPCTGSGAPARKSGVTSNAVLRHSFNPKVRSAARASAASLGARKKAMRPVIARPPAKMPRPTATGLAPLNAPSTSAAPRNVHRAASPASRLHTAPSSSVPTCQRFLARRSTASRQGRRALVAVTSRTDAGAVAAAVIGVAIPSPSFETTGCKARGALLKFRPRDHYFFADACGLGASECSTSRRSIVPSARSESIACPSATER